MDQLDITDIHKHTHIASVNSSELFREDFSTLAHFSKEKLFECGVIAARCDDFTLMNELLLNPLFLPTESYSLILRTASFNNSTNVIQLLLNDGRCTASDFSNHIINGKNTLQTFKLLFNHNSFCKEQYNTIFFKNIIKYKNKECADILSLALKSKFYRVEDINYIFSEAYYSANIEAFNVIYDEIQELPSANATNIFYFALDLGIINIAYDLYIKYNLEHKVLQESKDMLKKIQCQNNIKFFD